MTEHDFDSQIRSLISLYGWMGYRTWISIHSPKGFVDWFCVRGDRLVALELKGDKGKLTDDQVICLELLRLTRKIETYALWPEDSDLAVSILRADTHDEIEEA